MGNGRVFRCEKCNNGSILMVGVGAGFPDEYKEIIKDIKNGVYGENYKEKLLSRKDIAVDLETNLYVCDKCGDWNVNYCFDFYIPKDKEDIDKISKEDFYIYPNELKERFERIEQIVHYCDECKNEMRKIVDINEDISLKCNICNSNMKEEGFMNWD